MTVSWEERRPLVVVNELAEGLHEIVESLFDLVTPSTCYPCRSWTAILDGFRLAKNSLRTSTITRYSLIVLRQLQCSHPLNHLLYHLHVLLAPVAIDLAHEPPFRPSALDSTLLIPFQRSLQPLIHPFRSVRFIRLDEHQARRQTGWSGGDKNHRALGSGRSESARDQSEEFKVVRCLVLSLHPDDSSLSFSVCHRFLGYHVRQLALQIFLPRDQVPALVLVLSASLD